MGKDSIKITGKFRLDVYENGKLVKRYVDKNLVVKGGRQAILNVMAAGTGFIMQDISFGTNGTAPVDADNAITAPYTKPLSAVNIVYPDVTFDFNLGGGEANGMTIQEFGLKTNTGALFARKTGISVNKTSSVTMVGAWTITVSP